MTLVLGADTQNRLTLAGGDATETISRL